MISQESMKKKLENMHLKERIDYGYRKVITMMLISGLLSVVIIGVLFANMMHYVENVNAADQAVKICRINVNAAARNIREMALNEDTSSYDNYEQTVKRLLSEVDSELQILKKTEVLSDENYEEYSSALSDWGEIGYSIIEEIKNGNDENATDAILNNCTPALNKVVEIAIKLDELTDEASSETVRNMVVCTVAGFVVIIVCLVFAFTLTRKTSKRVLETILEPLHAIEDVAMELTEGNLHSTLEYHSDDEIGKLAHSMRKSIRILGTYVDDIDRSMKLFSEGNFDVHPEVEWRGDFVGILNSFMAFQASMAGTIKGIQNVSNEVSGAAEQVASSSNDLADGATNQAAVVEELTATVTGVSEQVEKNSQSAKEISVKVDELGNAISESNGKMHEMVDSMHEISEASKEIDKIITTINEIASQTNLLALNASIEAARAGEAGKGFSVVATEISKLAQNTASSVEEISQLISQVDGLVDDAVNQANVSVQNIGESGGRIRVAQETFEQIYTCIEDMKNGINNMITQIAAVNNVAMDVSAISEEQAASTTVISETSDAMVDQANNLAGQSEQVADSSKVLTNTSEQLAEQMGRFQI